MRLTHSTLWLVCAALALTSSLFGASALDSLSSGKLQMQSAGPLAFGPDGVLFVGDSAGASILALDTGDRTPGSGGMVNVAAINEKIAGLLGAAPDEIQVNDMAVNPISRNTYFSVSRGRGPDAAAVILRADASGKLSELALDSIKHSRVALPNAPAPDAADDRGRPLRVQSITDLAYVDGNVIIAGLSNEEFASNLRSIPFPFSDADGGTSVEIFHGAHGRWETNSPIRTFVPYEVQNESQILAAYTCTPLVKFPVSQLKPGTKVVGKTIAELGNRNRPLDMIVYKKGGKDYILMSNSSRGVMKMSAEGVDEYEAIKAKTDITGLPYETIDELQGIQQLDAYNDSHAIVLAQDDGGALNLKTIALP